MEDPNEIVGPWAKLLSPKRLRQSTTAHSPQDKQIDRTQYERDFDRVLFSAPVRRLADKTQVFPLEANDSVRTRLTHSQEVASLARQIGVHLVCKTKIFGDNSPEILLRAVPSILGTVGLAHDIGNPPFGHQGEYAIQSWMFDHSDLLSDLDEAERLDFLDFEGNAQALRILASLQEPFGEYGLNLTVAALSALMKYPTPSDGRKKKDCRRKKFGYFQSEKEIVASIWSDVGLSKYRRHPLAYLMETADDIAYRCLDVEDAVKKKLASYDDLSTHLKVAISKPSSTHQQRELVAGVLKATDDSRIKQRAGSRSNSELNDITMQFFRVHAMTAMTHAAVEAFCENISEITKGEFSSSLIKAGKAELLADSLKRFASDTAYNSTAVLRLEARGFKIIQETMDMTWAAISEESAKTEIDRKRKLPLHKYVFSRISDNYIEIASSPKNTMSLRYRELQLLNDMMSGMTDTFLVEFHKDLKSLYAKS